MISFLPGIASTADGLDAERTRLKIIAQNIANANTTRGPDGRPYQRREVVFQDVLQQAQGGNGQSGSQLVGPRVTQIVKDNTPFPLVYEPGHPDANAQGMVALPNVNLYEEMADMIVASRAYEANLAVVKNDHSMVMQTLSIGKA